METNGTIICDPRQYLNSSIPNDKKRRNIVTRNLKQIYDFYIKQQTLKQLEKDRPVAALSIVGGSNQYLPNETIKNQLEYGLLEIMKTTKIWIKTDGENTGVGMMVKEFAKNKEKNLTVFDEDAENITNFKNTVLNQSDDALEAYITGDEYSFNTAMHFLGTDYPVLLLDGSGGAADYICKGYRLSSYKTSEDKCLLSDTFKSEMTEAAQYICGFNDGWRISKKQNCEKLAGKLQHGLETKWKLIHVHSINDTINSLDKAIQDALYQIFCKGNKKNYRIIDNILRCVDLWNRPDISEKEIFNIENINVVKTLQASLVEEESKLSKLFKNALVGNKVDIVKQVLEYIQDKRLYKTFLENNIKTLYKKTDCISRDLISEHSKCIARSMINEQEKNQKSKNFVKSINIVVIKILGSRKWKPFQENMDNKGWGNTEDTCNIYEGDVFKHLFIWAVLMDRRELAMLFWKKENSDYICSALYASSLARCLAEHASWEESIDQKTDLLESSRHYEDLAYSVMTELYRIDRKEARDMLVTKVKRYNSTTILEISEKFTLMKFMGHAACQTKLNKIWKGHISTNTSNIKAIIAAFIPIFIMKVVKTDNKVGPQKPNGTTSEVDTKWPDWRNIYYFYNSPMIKFLFHVLTYMAMLVIFCMFILTDLHPMSEKYPSVYEYIVYAMAGSLMIEETRQAFVIKQVSWNLMTWFSFWTLFEILMYSMFITSVFLRLTLSVGKFYHTRMTYAITLGLFIVNGMQFFLASRHIGPKVIMIGRMMYDIIFFILIFAVFVFGFGVIYQATMYPNSTLGFQLFKEIIYMPYWQLYGELFLAEFEGKEPSPCSHDVSLYSKGTIARCPEVNQINTLLLAIYMVVTHIILVNILIAMFSNTFTKVQDNNELVWKFHRYSLVQEYYDKSMLIPPLIIISHMFKIIMCMYNACRGITNGSNMFKLKRPDAPNKLEKKAVYNYFNLPARMRRYHAKNMEAEKDGLEASYEQDTELSLQEQFDLLSSDMDSMQENQLKTLQAINQLKEKQQKLLIVDVNSKTEGQIFVPVEMPITRSK